MSLKVNTKYGQVEVTNRVISTIVSEAVEDVFGVIGLASRNYFRDNLNNLLKIPNHSKGVTIKKVNDQIQVEVSIIVGFGMKISEIGKNVQDRIKYSLETTLSVRPSLVNVTVEGVELLDD